MVVAVKKGQCFSAARLGKQKRHIKVVHVALHRDRYGAHPVVSVREVTRTGRLKGRKSDPPIRIFLVANSGKWVMPPWYIEIKK